MKIGNYRFRKPWVKYVEIPFEEELYKEIWRSIGEDICKEIERFRDEGNFARGFPGTEEKVLTLVVDYIKETFE